MRESKPRRRIPFVISLAVLFVGLFWLVAAQAQGFHGAAIQKQCTSPSKAGDTTDCLIRASYNDDFGDTITIKEAWDVIDPLGSAVRVPAAGDLPIVSIQVEDPPDSGTFVDSNTDCQVGGTLPCNIGAGGSTLNGLPGRAPDGAVTFQQNTYVVQPGDPDPLPDQGTAIVRDLCDDPDTEGCGSIDNEIQFTAATDLIHPSVSVTKSGPDFTKTDPEDQPITYDVEICNTGDFPLVKQSVSDSLAGDLTADPALRDVLPVSGCDNLSYEYTVTDQDLDPVENIVEVHYKPDVEHLDNDITDSASWAVDILHPDFEVRKFCEPDPVLVGNDITWTVEVENTGDADLDIQVDDDTANIHQAISLAAGASQTLTDTRTVNGDGDSITNTVTATATLDARYGLDNVLERTATATCAVQRPSFRVEKRCEPDPVLVGDDITWTVDVFNTGTVALDVDVSDPTAGINETVLNLAAGATATLTGSRTVNGDGDSITNTVTATARLAGTQTVVGTDTATATCQVQRGREGCTPGYWKNHPDSWPPTGYSTDDRLGDVFTIPGSYDPRIGDATLLQALRFRGGSTVDRAAMILLRISTASLLNAAHPDVSFTHSEASVISDVNEALASRDRRTILTLAVQLDRDNNLGCPINGQVVDGD